MELLSKLCIDYAIKHYLLRMKIRTEWKLSHPCPYKCPDTKSMNYLLNMSGGKLKVGQCRILMR
jgi:hypothetical protein